LTRTAAYFACFIHNWGSSVHAYSGTTDFLGFLDVPRDSPLDYLHGAYLKGDLGCHKSLI